MVYNKIKDIVIFKGKKAKLGPVRTMDITVNHIRAVFFPKDFYETYKYLGSVPHNEKGEMFKYLEPLVIFMDYRAKPKWCPRWVLRFLHLFGNDNSLVRTRSLRLHNLHRRLTKGIFFLDWKVKWHNYDLRISISADEQTQEMADMIEGYVSMKGHRQDMIDYIKKTKYANELGDWLTYCELTELYRKSESDDNEEYKSVQILF